VFESLFNPLFNFGNLYLPMAYQCNDCSFTHKGKFPGGKCPACDSFNVRSDQKTNKPTDKQHKSWHLIALAALWAYLLFLVFQKLVN